MITTRHSAHAAFLAALVLSSVICRAQVPSQFKGLLTTKTDYTCVGVVPCPTWPMPPNPGKGGSYFDPTWGTTTWELNVPSAASGHNVIPTYNRVQSFSSDNKHLFLTEGNGQQSLDLYDATTTPPTPINRITTTDGTLINSYSGDANWSNTVPTRIYYVPWGLGVYGGAGLQLRYVDVSTCTTKSCVLTPTTVHTFSCKSDSYFPDGAGLPGNLIETGSGAQGGMFDLTDTYFSFTCDIANGNGRGEIDFIRYNRGTDTVTTQEKWYQVCPGNVPSGCGVWASDELAHKGYNMIRMNQHPSANYITVVWQCAKAPWVKGCGSEAYGPTYNLLGPISGGNYHQDNGFDVHGVPVWVGVGGSTGYSMDYYSLTVVNLTTLSMSGFTGKTLKLPCSFAYMGPNPCGGSAGGRFLNAKVSASHVSMTGTWGSVPGYALMSTMSLAGSNGAYVVDVPAATTLGTPVRSPGVTTVTPGSMANIGVGTQQVIDFGNANAETVTVAGVTSSTFTATFAKTHTAAAPVSNLTAGDSGPYAMEDIAVKIDTTAADGSTAQVWRLGRTMSLRDADYNAEPHTTVNRDWTAYVWGSNWNTDNGRVNSFWTRLPAAVPKTGNASASPGEKPE
jgi:hypothetical protein